MKETGKIVGEMMNLKGMPEEPLGNLPQMLEGIVAVARTVATIGTVQTVALAQDAMFGMRQLETAGAVGLLVANVSGTVREGDMSLVGKMGELVAPLSELNSKAGEILAAVQAAGGTGIVDKANSIAGTAGSAIGVVDTVKSMIGSLPETKPFNLVGKVLSFAASPQVLMIVAAIAAVAAAVGILGTIFKSNSEKKQTTPSTVQITNPVVTTDSVQTVDQNRAPAELNNAQTGETVANVKSYVNVGPAEQVGAVNTAADQVGAVNSVVNQTAVIHEAAVQIEAVNTAAGRDGTNHSFESERALLEEARQSERATLVQQIPNMGEAVFHNTLNVEKMVTEMNEEQLREWFVRSIERERSAGPNGVYQI